MIYIGNIINTNKDLLLNFAIENGIINVDNILEHVDSMKKKEIIKQHPYDIWEASDGRWKTYIRDDTKSNNRKLVARSTQEKIYEIIIDEYNKNINVLTFEKAYRQWIEYSLSLIHI